MESRGGKKIDIIVTKRTSEKFTKFESIKDSM